MTDIVGVFMVVLYYIFMERFLLRHGQKLRFGLVGVINTLCDIVLFALFANILGIYIIWSNVLSTGVTLILSFVLNYSFVWKSKKSKFSTAPKFLASTLITAWGVQNAVIWVVTAVFSEKWLFVENEDWLNIVAKVCAIGVGMVINYLIYKIIFTDKKEER